MQKIFLMSVLLATVTLPVTADISKTASTATCDSATIGATNGTAYMDTDWTANTINLQWYSNGEQINVSGTDSATCTYDGTITLPSDPQEPTGYTFGGWRVRVAAGPAQCNISDITSLDTATNGSAYAYIKFDGTASTALSNGTRKTPDAYNITNPGEWAVEFEYGTIKGIARCSTVGSGYTKGQTGNPTDDLDLNDLENGAAQYCWCQLTGFDSDKDGEYCTAASLWVFHIDRGSAASCASGCADRCGYSARANEALRPGLFGSVAQ